MPEIQDLSALSAQDFAPAVGSAFELTLPELQPIRLTLLSVTPQAQNNHGPAGRRPFSLLFAGPAQVKLTQRIFPLRHETLGLLEIFLVPIRETTDQRHYEAVFA